MAIIEELRTPLYFAAGTADLAMKQAKKVPGLIEQIAAEAPARIDAVRNTDPKVVQEKVSTQAKEAQATVQAKVTEVFGSLDTDLKKLGETAQDFALRSVGVAAEYAVKARETYEKVAEHGEQAVRIWRGEAADEITEIAVAVEPEPAPKKAGDTKADEPKAPAAKRTAPAKKAPGPAPASAPTPAPRKPAAKKTAPSDK
ncbi:hypothetical protein QWM81_19395 [Streptomyces ficellus]|uniref:Heparin-binding hemagglutinin n=1 Tax=Streptomyces ficellus TaxID=1977088 RepID=A0ABT7ZAW3_9ACTN|nr:hypothetical protein [Streptomyces ficellus]MDN3296186.1 hypothetical protein [Streptomyces ficellus]